ncbi:MAG: phosphoribosylglycinamide formyltransferase, partial [Alkaliphilus sp.]|nr:phosphoribosylglycinamide formyltransferase [Alkaliphilus sp.]
KDIDLVVLAGYMSILGKQLIKAFENRIINVHPSLIPSFCGKGFYGDKVHEAVLDYGSKISGATVHFVDEGTDTGAIILQEAVEVLQSDTVETLGKRVLEVEHRLLPRAIKLFSENRLMIEGRRVMINIEGQRG